MTNKINTLINDNVPSMLQKPEAAHYEDVGHFTTDLRYVEPPACEKKPIGGFPSASLEELLVAQAKTQLGTKGWNALSLDEQHQYLANIASSCINRPDIEATVSVGNGNELKTFHQFCHNSPLNGLAYCDAEGNRVEITHGIASSQDRDTPNTQMLRRVSNSHRTLVYTGRPETDRKAEEQAKWMFQQERKASFGRGIRYIPEMDAQGRHIYEFTYVVDSLLSSSIVFDPKCPDRHEKLIIEGEKEALQKLRANRDGLIVIDPKTGKECRVRFKPIFMQNVFNWAFEMNRALPSWISGADIEEENAQEGLDWLREYAANLEVDNLSLKDRLDQALALSEDFHSYTPEKKVIVLALLAEACELPLVIHCMSSKDRTGMCIALISALNQYRELGLYRDVNAMLKDEKFKELFCANLMVAHNVANFGRGAQGEFWGQQLEDLFGLETTMNQTFLRLLPKRYIEETLKPLWATLATPFIIVGAVLLTLCGVIGTIIHSYRINSLLPMAQFFAGGFIVDFARFTARGYELIPAHKLRKDIPSVAHRCLKKAKQKYPLSPSVLNLIQNIGYLNKQEYDGLMNLFQSNGKPTDLQKAFILLICKKRDELERVLKIKKLSKQLPKQAKDLIAAALDWKMVHFDTVTNQNEVIDFFQTSGKWHSQIPPREIERLTNPFLLPDGSFNEEAIKFQFNRDLKGSTITLVDGIPANTFEECLNHLSMRGIERNEMLRLLCATQQGGHATAIAIAGYSFPGLLQGIMPVGEIWLIQNHSETNPMRANIDTVNRKIVLTSPFAFNTGGKYLTCETTLDIDTDTGTAQFTITDQPPSFSPQFMPDGCLVQ